VRKTELLIYQEFVMEKDYSVMHRFLITILVAAFPLTGIAVPANDGIILYTPYTSQSITPGETLNYSIEIINQSDGIENLSLSVQGIPGSWEPSITSGNSTIQQIAVKPAAFESENSRTVGLGFTIPLEIDQGTYRFEFRAQTDTGRQYTLPLQVRVTEQGVFETEMEVTQANMEGYADSEFNYTTTLTNRTAATQNYALAADPPPGWNVRFRVRGNYATSVTLDSNESETINVTVRSPSRAEADTYHIGIRAVSGNTYDEATLETVIQGQHDLELTTPTGRLSESVTAGRETTIPLLVRNTGTVPLRNITLGASPPSEWSVEFDIDESENEIFELQPGESRTIDATIRASSRAIAGDYRLGMNASTSEASSNAAFRVTVNRSIAGGTVGMLFILLVVGGISFMIKKYGRR
jgi:uncharacterized membrane protein